MAAIAFRFVTSWFFSPEDEQDSLLFDAAMKAAQRLTVDLEKYVNKSDIAKLTVRLKMWRTEIMKEVFQPTRGKHVEIHFTVASAVTRACGRRFTATSGSHESLRSIRHVRFRLALSAAVLQEDLRKMLRRVRGVNRTAVAVNGEVCAEFGSQRSTSFNFLFTPRRSRMVFYSFLWSFFPASRIGLCTEIKLCGYSSVCFGTSEEKFYTRNDGEPLVRKITLLVFTGGS